MIVAANYNAAGVGRGKGKSKKPWQWHDFFPHYKPSVKKQEQLNPAAYEAALREKFDMLVARTGGTRT